MNELSEEYQEEYSKKREAVVQEDFPEEFYRGFTGLDSVSSDGFVAAAAFQFPKDTDREDRFIELSVNWNDDAEALATLSAWHKKGQKDRQFKYGYCVVNRAKMEIFLRPYIMQNVLKYERRPEFAGEANDFQNNIYHGNLLMAKEISNTDKRTIQYSLAALGNPACKWED